MTAVATLVALGVFAADRVAGEVRLEFSRGGERFRPLGSAKEQELAPDRLVLADDRRVLSLFAHRDGAHQAVDGTTTRMLLLACVVDGIAPQVAADSLHRAAELLASS